MEDRASSFLTTPVAILIGAILISIAVLMHGGIIKVGNTPKGTAQAPAQQPGANQPAPQAAKTVDQMIQSFKDEAKKLGLDSGKFNSCLDGGGKASAVSKDLADGSTAGVNGTPAFFINGRLISGAVPYEQFKTVIEEELNGTTPANVTKVQVGVGDLPALGNQNAKVTMIEFSDYQCPFCERHFTQAESQIKKDYIDTGKVKMYYRDFPLSQIHPGAQKAAEAARCAGDQGKYWEYHDLLFQNQQNIF